MSSVANFLEAYALGGDVSRLPVPHDVMYLVLFSMCEHVVGLQD